MTASDTRTRLVKCVVWDLDNTLWQGTLLEEPVRSLRPGVAHVVRALDRRGILHSIASRNDHDLAMAKLREFGLEEFFLCPQINWSPKSSSIQAVARALNIGTDSLAFVDDEVFERDEVMFSLPEVLCVSALETAALLERSEFTPPVVTDDAGRRRLLYRADQVRRTAEDEFAGPKEEFLATLDMTLRITPAGEHDLLRAQELTVRTNQLNTTGYTYSYEELDRFRRSGSHKLLMARLDDRYGPYGNVGLALVETGAGEWTIKLLLMSCRVMSRGVGTVVINHLRSLARRAGVRLVAEFVPTDRNRMMYVSYKFNRFQEIERRDGLVRLEADLDDVPPPPSYVRLEAGEG